MIEEGPASNFYSISCSLFTFLFLNLKENDSDNSLVDKLER